MVDHRHFTQKFPGEPHKFKGISRISRTCRHPVLNVCDCNYSERERERERESQSHLDPRKDQFTRTVRPVRTYGSCVPPLSTLPTSVLYEYHLTSAGRFAITICIAKQQQPTQTKIDMMSQSIIIPSGNN